nr:MAG TPA: hypothetical protein [Caudoviricetes sp.]
MKLVIFLRPYFEFSRFLISLFNLLMTPPHLIFFSLLDNLANLSFINANLLSLFIIIFSPFYTFNLLYTAYKSKPIILYSLSYF